MFHQYLVSACSFIFAVIIIGIIAIIGSSGGGGGGGDDGEGDGGNGGGGQLLTITGESGKQVVVIGTWQGICNPDSDDGSSDSADLTISTATSFSMVQSIYYNNMVCDGASDVTIITSGTATKGNEVAVSLNGSNVTATKIDTVITSAQVTGNNASTIDQLNTEGQCGFNDWVMGVAKDILGTTCVQETDQKDVIYINDTAEPDVLYTGDDDGPVDADGYPTSLDLDSEAERL